MMKSGSVSRSVESWDSGAAGGAGSFCSMFRDRYSKIFVSKIYLEKNVAESSERSV